MQHEPIKNYYFWNIKKYMRNDPLNFEQDDIYWTCDLFLKLYPQFNYSVYLDNTQYIPLPCGQFCTPFYNNV